MDDKPNRTEHYKVVFDYLKHITTLSTGSILLMATFVDKLFVSSEWKILAKFSISGFMICILAATLSYTLAIIDLRLSVKSNEFLDVLLGFAIITIWFSFLLGVFSLAIFAWINIG